MATIEIYVKLKLRPESLADFRARATVLVGAARADSTACLRCDWFVNEKRGEAIGMLAFRDAAALVKHRAEARGAWAALESAGEARALFIGAASQAARDAVASLQPRVVTFDSGLEAGSGARRYELHLGTRATPHIEIFTHFAVKEGRMERFRKYAAECLAAVKEKDPGTARYDWFYDAAGRVSIAMDTYDDPASMFAHMKNCHDPHHELLVDSTMITEFLGELPPDAMQAVAKYDPYVARFVVGLRPYSSGSLR